MRGRETGSRSKKKGVVRVRGECVWGWWCRFCEEPISEGWELTSRMGKGKARPPYLVELSTLTPAPALFDRPVGQGLLEAEGGDKQSLANSPVSTCPANLA